MKRIGWAMLAVAAVAGFMPLLGNAAVHDAAVAEAALASLPVPSAGALPDAARRLEACVSERKGGRSAARCIGLLAEPCLKAWPTEAASCNRAEAEGWQALVFSYQSRLEQRFGADGRKRAELAQAQAEWWRDRVKRCEAATAGGEPAGASCEVKETSRRALYLRILADQAGII